MTGKRKRDSAEFKAKMALEAIWGELTVSQLVAKPGVRHLTVITRLHRDAERYEPAPARTARAMGRRG